MSDESESLMLRLLRDMRAELGDMRAEIKSDMHSLRADVAADLLEARRDMAEARKESGEQIVGLRRAVVEYHTSVIGHGVLISDLEARVRRIEQHLEHLPPRTWH